VGRPSTDPKITIKFPEGVRGIVPPYLWVVPPEEDLLHGGRLMVADRATPEGVVTVLLCRCCGARREHLIDFNDLSLRGKSRLGKKESKDAERMAWLARAALWSQLDATVDQWKGEHAHCRAGQALEGCHPQVRDQALLIAEAWSAELRRRVHPAPFIAPIESRAMGGPYTLPVPNDEDMPPGLSASERAGLVVFFAIVSIAGLRARYRRRGETLIGAVSCLVEWADGSRGGSAPAGELVTRAVDEHVGYEGRAPITISGPGRDATVDVGQTVWGALTSPSVWIDGVLAGRRRILP
jgi:hypothetical protein